MRGQCEEGNSFVLQCKLSLVNVQYYDNANIQNKTTEKRSFIDVMKDAEGLV